MLPNSPILVEYPICGIVLSCLQRAGPPPAMSCKVNRQTPVWRHVQTSRFDFFFLFHHVEGRRSISTQFRFIGLFEMLHSNTIPLGTLRLFLCFSRAVYASHTLSTLLCPFRNLPLSLAHAHYKHELSRLNLPLIFNHFRVALIVASSLFLSHR